MRINKLNVTNFKTLVNHQLSLAGITLLAGANSVGKSSTIQTLLFIRSLVEKVRSKNLQDSEGNIKIPLNGSFMLSLGSTKEVVSWETGRKFIIELEGDNSKYLFEFEAEDLELTNYFINASFPKFNDSRLNLFAGEFYYLNAERLGPRIQYGVNENPSNLHCGFQGEFTTEVLARYGNDVGIVSESKFLKGQKLLGAQSLSLYTRQWLSYIIPDTDLDNAELFGIIRSTSVKFNSFFSAPNVGFGVSYILPIIVSGLIAKPDSLIIVENPEAHLHPKGQSRIGYFLGCMASTGIQIIVETHSEHVINGIRLASVETKLTDEKDVLINFYNHLENSDLISIDQIKLNTRGDLSDFPPDFFDQSQQDLLEMMKKAQE